MKLLLDMNIAPRWVNFLLAQGLEAVHWSNVGAPTAQDSEIMDFARAGGYTVFTHDLDFSAILAATKGKKPSVVQLRTDDISPEAVGGQLVQTLRQMQNELEAGALLTVDTKRTRLRVLPL
jgi:predicted nuclease of predicted toxin-antitoxin system